MQSFRQYRQLKRSINEQIKGHGAPMNDSRQENPAQATSRSTLEDPEKQGNDNGTISIPGTHAFDFGHDASKTNENKDEQAETSPVSETSTSVFSHDTAGLKDDALPTRDRTTEMETLQPVASVKQAKLADEAEAPQNSGGLGVEIGKTMTGISIRRRTTKGAPAADVFVVGFQGPDDDLNPHNWPMRKRVIAMLHVGMVGWIVGFASAIDAPIVFMAAAEFGTSTTVESLATGLYLMAFGFGSLVAGPFSEEFGRNPIYIGNLIIFMIWTMASGLAPNIAAQLVFRFLAGFFGSTPLTCAGGSLSDLFTPKERVGVFAIFATCAFIGPLFGPVISSWIAQSDTLIWRWTEWITLILTSAILTSLVLFQPETYSPILLKYKAQLLREATGDSRYVAAVEVRADTFGRRLARALYRPFQIFVQEPIVVLFAVYLAVVYVVFFGFLEGFDYIFGEVYGLPPGLSGLTFLGIAVGIFLASTLVPLMYRWYNQALQKAQGRGETRLPPEMRLWWAMIGAPLLPVALFWMGWTARPDVPLWSPLGASVVFGYSTLCLFISVYQYLVDCYEIFAASALASTTIVRYVACGGMVVGAAPMYKSLGAAVTLSIWGAISAALVPVPFLFYRYGAKIRSYSKFAID